MPEFRERLTPGVRIVSTQPLADHPDRRKTAPEAASPGARVLGAAVDGAMLGAIDLVVTFLTLKVCGFTVAELRLLPPIPLVSFLLLLNGGYFVAFTTAGGQTIGKMASHIRVVTAHVGRDGNHRVTLSIAIVRAAAYLVSILPAGLGFVPALVGSDRRAVHDRLADTLVIQA
jgi:uncharacterized RDD family membrane protein YckC